MKTKFEDYVEQVDSLIRDYTRKLHITELDAIEESIERFTCLVQVGWIFG